MVVGRVLGHVLGQGHGRRRVVPGVSGARGARRLAVTLALALGGALVALLADAEVLVHRCVAGDGMAGWLGLRLALLRTDVECPSGTLAVGGDGRQVAGVLVVVALPVLLAHLGVAATGLAVLAALRGAVRDLTDALRAVVRRVPGAASVVLVRARLAVASTVAAPSAVGGSGGVLRRGPPALAAA
ncbi:hypothetical protein [Cellulomonas carbonis]|uniref:hypothetical protein n=2 Tax=Cellulomonas carbonis TaxID=1386092 RepID=UPI00166841ED|nr:hypothetical protein [Cellulomonas carbonis]